MARHRTLIAIVVTAALGLVTLAAAGCSGLDAGKQESAAERAKSFSVIIRVTGTPGLRFSGNIGDSGHQTPVGTRTIPADLSIKDPSRAILINLQKLDQAGTMKVTVLRDGKELARGQNKAQWGMVNLTVPMTE